MLPLLQHCAVRSWSIGALVAQIADDLCLTPDERTQQIPSGGISVIGSRVHWAKTYLKKGGLVEQPKRGVVQITVRGRALLATNPSRIDSALLGQYEEFRTFAGRQKADQGSFLTAAASASAESVVTLSTPEEQIATAYATQNEALRDALLARVLDGTPSSFERMLVDLLLAMGYGGSRADAGEQLGGTGDGGVDGVIREDQLGLDRVYLQAKRYRPGKTVEPETVRAFVGALVGKGAQKGVLITTSSFSKAAVAAASQSGHVRVVLIDGDELTKLMVRFSVGVRIARTIEIKRIDLDYFEDMEPE
jgi:restriction system protein